MIGGVLLLLVTVIAWLAVVVACFLKGKWRLGLVLVLLAVIPVVTMGAPLVDELWLSDPLDPNHDQAVEFGWAFLIVAWLLFGGFTGAIALAAAWRPAKPGSWWAIRHEPARPGEEKAPERVTR